MPKVKIDPEFQSLIPPLTESERAQLERNLIDEGCRDAMVTWRGLLLDGHNRYEICERRGIEYQEWEIELAGRDAAIEWIIRNQFGRRNLPLFVRAELALRLEPLIAAKAKERQGARTDLLPDIPQKSAGSETREELAKVAGVSHDTITKAKHLLENTSDDVRAQLRSGDLSINAAYKESKGTAHVSHNSGDNEWFTPPEYVEMARESMGGIDLDPASSEVANAKLKIKRIFTKEDDGLSKPWAGKIYCNPPYATGLIGPFCEKLVGHYNAGDVTQAVVLVNNGTETKWFQLLLSAASAVCFPAGRIQFWHPTKVAVPLQGQAIVYLGDKHEAFAKAFSQTGAVAYVKRF